MSGFSRLTMEEPEPCHSLKSNRVEPKVGHRSQWQMTAGSLSAMLGINENCRRVMLQKGFLGSVHPKLLQFVASYQVSLTWRLAGWGVGMLWQREALGSKLGPKMQWTQGPQGHPNGMMCKRYAVLFLLSLICTTSPLKHCTTLLRQFLYQCGSDSKLYRAQQDGVRRYCCAVYQCKLWSCILNLREKCRGLRSFRDFVWESRMIWILSVSQTLSYTTR